MKVVVLTDNEHKMLQDMCDQACDTVSPSALTVQGSSLLEQWERVRAKVNEAK